MTIRITPGAEFGRKGAGGEARGLSQPERRSARRFRVTWSVVIKGTDEAGLIFDEPGELEVLSSGGAVFYLARSVKAGAGLTVRLRVPFKRDNWMIYMCEVVRIKNAGPRFRVAVKFGSRRPRFMKGHAGPEAAAIPVV
ncbi:MAG: PilZ domain-containing protein [Blastocatellia bacterium]